jgi:hypothetical protein
MKGILNGHVSGCIFLLCFVPAVGSGAAQFVGLTTELQICDWDYLFFYDRNRKHPDEAGTASIFAESNTRRCVIGADTWMIESTFPTFEETRWFTGTNIIAHTVVTKQAPDTVTRQISQAIRLTIGDPAPVGHRYTKVHESLDGNPGRPGGVADLMGFDLPASISWLAFCSGPALRREGRRIYPPSPMWKESTIFYSGWSDSTEVFEDTLGLPRSITLVSTNGQSIFQYQVRDSTNVLGWNIPLEFYGVQYLPTGTNAWKLHLTFKGRVTSIGPATQPEIPPAVMQVIEK